MADTKISALTADTSPTADDLIATVNDPGGTPASKSTTLGNAITKASGLTGAYVKAAAGVLTAGAIAQADLPVMTGDSGSGGVKGAVPAPATGDATKFLRGDGTFQTIGGGGDALTTNPLSQFAATTSAQLKTVLSDETGSGAAVFANSPALVTPTGIVKGDVGLGNVDNTSDATKNAASATLTNKTLTSPVVNTPTGIVKGDVGLGNVDNTSNATERAATATLTNKRITARITTIVSNATPTVNTDDCDAVTITALAAAITSMTTNLSGTPTNFQKLIYRLKDDGTARGITWGASFEAMGVALPTTTVLSKVLTVGFLYNTVTSKWGCVASVQEA